MKAKVHVYLKPGVLDVQGKAIEGALHGLGWGDVANVRVGKTIEFEVPGSDKAKAEAEAKKLVGVVEGEVKKLEGEAATEVVKVIEFVKKEL